MTDQSYPYTNPEDALGGPAFGPYPPRPFPPDARIRRRHRTRPVVAAGLVAGTLAASVAVGHELWPPAASNVSASPAATVPGSPGLGSPGLGSSASSNEGSGGPSDVSTIASKVNPAVVDIWTTLGYQGAQGAGTGIVLTSNGEILTNNHVINGATSIKVTDIGNGRTYPASVVGYDSSHDVAVLQLSGASGLTAASLGNSSAAKVGQPVVAIGNAGGAGGTPSAAGGSITALNQSITASDQLDGTSESLTNLIETNADVQSGDSGGPLVNSAGQVLGMDSAASSGYSLQSMSGTSSRGYAIPINEALSIAHQIESGKPSSTVHVGSTAFLGVMISSSPQSGSYGGYPVPGGFGYGYGAGGSSSASPTSGAPVAGVVPGGAAQTAGLAAGDVITAVNGQSIASPAALSHAMVGERPGQTIQLSWTDSSGIGHTATVTLQAGPPA